MTIDEIILEIMFIHVKSPVATTDNPLRSILFIPGSTYILDKIFICCKQSTLTKHSLTFAGRLC